MARAAIWNLCVLLFCLAAAFSAHAQDDAMYNPLFGMPYDPQKIHFEKLPARLVHKCPELQGRYVAAWVYGRFKTADSEYFVIMGLMKFEDEEKPGIIPPSIAIEDGDGLVVALRGSKCLVDQSDYFFDQKINPARGATPIMAPEFVLTGIMQDGLKRCAIAYGGRQECLKRARADLLIPFLQKQINILRQKR